MKNGLLKQVNKGSVMNLALIGCLDYFATLQIKRIIQTIACQGINNSLSSIDGHCFHVSFLDFQLESDEDLITCLNQIDFSILDVSIFQAGYFEGAGVFYLSPHKHELMKKLHRDICIELRRFTKPQSYYLPDVWQPHVTLGIGLNETDMMKAYEITRALLSPIKTKINTFVLIEVIENQGRILGYKEKWRKEIG